MTKAYLKSTQIDLVFNGFIVPQCLLCICSLNTIDTTASQSRL